MRQRIPIVPLIAMITLLICSCNNESESTVMESDDTATASTTSQAKPSYDTSKSVTVISPELYKSLSDTLGIRMLQGIYKPGDSSIMHGHPDFALYVLEGGMVELTGEDGSKQNIEFIKDMAVIMPAATHSAKNIGNTTLKLIVVEVDRPR